MQRRRVTFARESSLRHTLFEEGRANCNVLTTFSKSFMHDIEELQQIVCQVRYFGDGMSSSRLESGKEKKETNRAAAIGGTIGALKYGAVFFAVAVIGQFISPIYRKLTIQFKVYLQLSGMTMGGMIEADRRVRLYELQRVTEKRREQEEATWKRWEHVMKHANEDPKGSID